jgi:DNA-binding HxlR family transcriptional regulator
MGTRTARGFGQYGGVARALERIGERWALLIVRDLLSGARRYSDLKAGLPRIPTNILSDRLKELQEAGVIRRVPTIRGGYELTALGRELEPVVLALERWGWAALGDPREDEVLTGDALAVALRAAFRPEAAAVLPPTEYVLNIGVAAVSAIVADGGLDVVPIGPAAVPQPARREPAGAPAPDLLELSIPAAGLHALLSGDPRSADVLVGDDALLQRFRKTFGADPHPSASADASSDSSAA